MSGSANSEAALVFDQVSRHFGPGGTWAALDGLSLECRPGSATCLVGPNGAGKTTALAIAAGLLPASAGEIRFHGRLLGPSQPPTGLGYLPQQSSFPGVQSVVEVLDFAVAVRGSSAASRQEAIELGGLHEVLGRRVVELSSGWVRRLGLALALLEPSDLLLLDEPFVGLDLATLERSLASLRRRVAEGTVVVVASHDFDVIDRLEPVVAVLDAGRLIARVLVKAAGEGSRSIYQRALGAANDPIGVGTRESPGFEEAQ